MEAVDEIKLYAVFRQGKFLGVASTQETAFRLAYEFAMVKNSFCNTDCDFIEVTLDELYDDQD